MVGLVKYYSCKKILIGVKGKSLIHLLTDLSPIYIGFVFLAGCTY